MANNKILLGVLPGLLAFGLVLNGCGTLIPTKLVDPPSQQGQISTVKEFALSQTTKVAVKVDSGLGMSDSSEVAAELEDALLGLGLSVAPYDVAVSATRTDVSVESTENSTSGSAMTYSARYMPAAIVISPIYNIMLGAYGNYIAGATFRVLDLSTYTLLASFKYEYKNPAMSFSVNIPMASGRSTIRDFIADFKEYIEQ